MLSIRQKHHLLYFGFYLDTLVFFWLCTSSLHISRYRHSMHKTWYSYVHYFQYWSWYLYLVTALKFDNSAFIKVGVTGHLHSLESPCKRLKRDSSYRKSQGLNLGLCLLGYKLGCLANILAAAHPNRGFIINFWAANQRPQCYFLCFMICLVNCFSFSSMQL